MYLTNIRFNTYSEYISYINEYIAARQYFLPIVQLKYLCLNVDSFIFIEVVLFLFKLRVETKRSLSLLLEP